MARRTHPWKWLCNSAEGAFTDQDLTELADQFGLDKDDLKALSQNLIWPLRDFRLLPPLDNFLRAPKKGNRAREDAIRHLAAARRSIGKAIVALEEFEVTDRKTSGTLTETMKLMRKRVRRAGGLLDWPHRWLVRTCEDDLDGWHKEPEDKRGRRDNKRRAVLDRIFAFWSEQGRPLTVTTDPVKSERKGALLEFTNAVVVRVSEPPTPLSPETIVKDLKQYKAFLPLLEHAKAALAEKQGF